MEIYLTASAVFMCISGILYGYFRGRWGNKSLVFKALATSVSVLTAALGVFDHKDAWGCLILAGLFLCMTADVALEIDFIKGIVLFGCAHLCFGGAYLSAAKPEWYTFICFFIVYGTAFLLFRKEIPALGKLRLPAFVYMALLISMVSMSFTVYIQSGGIKGLLVFAGGICFLVSDCIIGFRTVKHKDSLLFGAAILILYYSAVYLISISSVL